VRKDEWDDLREDFEVFIKNYNESIEKVKELTKENNNLREKLRIATERMATTERQSTNDLQQTSQTIQKLRAEISRTLDHSKKIAKD
jgi:methyl-accepting chemotaxis protein